MTHFESPEGVTGVGASVEEAAGLCSRAQQILCREALSLGNVTNLRETTEKCKLQAAVFTVNTQQVERFRATQLLQFFIEIQAVQVKRTA